jgi:hypothetical protein
MVRVTNRDKNMARNKNAKDYADSDTKQGREAGDRHELGHIREVSVRIDKERARR